MKYLKDLSLLLSALFVFCCAFSSTAYAKDGKNSIVSTDHQIYSYKELEQDLAQLEEKYPNRCAVNILGQTADERNIYEVRIGNENAKKHLIVLANIHAREYMTTQLCMKQIEYYLKYYNKSIDSIPVAEVFDEVAVHFIPSLNPDGTAISQYGFDAIRNEDLRKWLKKTNASPTQWKANARGVDLNRNWDIQFKKAGKRGPLQYTGSRGNSEKEIKAVLKLVEQLQENYKIVGEINYHAYGSMIYGIAPTSLDSYVIKCSNKLKNVAVKETGYYVMPHSMDRGIMHSSRDYFYHKLGVGSITIEIGSRGVPIKSSEFSSIWKKNKNVVFKSAAAFSTHRDNLK
ncbi:MAG: M14 family zinc carboxypeptidase [Eubacterium sp.]